jgi:hypothetical protein
VATPGSCPSWLVTPVPGFAMSLLYYTYLAQTTGSLGLKLAACIMLLVGLLAQLGGFFLHLLIGKPGHFSAGNMATILGALLLAFAVLLLAYGLIVARTF